MYCLVSIDFVLSSISIAFEMEPKLLDVILELASEASLITVFPFAVDNFECQIFVGWTRMKAQNSKIFVVRTRRLEVKTNTISLV